MIRPVRTRSVITGVGILAANGNDKEAFWDSLIAGRSGITRITLFDASELRCQIAGEVKGFEPAYFLSKGTRHKRLARHTQFAVATARMALEDAVLRPEDLDRYHAVPVYIGVSTSAIDVIERGMERMRVRGADKVPPYIVPFGQPQAVSSAVVEQLGVHADSLTFSTACAAGIDAIAAAAAVVRQGRADIALAGGTDAPVTQFTFASLDSAGLMSTRNEDPERASRPFDLERDSGVISEGAGMVVIENLEHARARGAVPYAEITGFASHVDNEPACHGSGLERTMRIALANAGRSARDVDFICAHGPGHPEVDRVETAMIKKVFEEQAYQTPVTSIKGVTGNPLGAAGAHEVIASALAISRGEIPPTANYEFPDPECDLDYVAGSPRRMDLRCALLNLHGLGGTNTSLVEEAVES